MPEQHGKIVTQPIELGDNVVVARTLADYAIGSGDISSGAVVLAKLRAYQVNASQPNTSGPLTLSHSLGTTPTMYGATPLSHADFAQLLHVEVANVNNSQMTIRGIFSLSGTYSGGVLNAPVSGLPYHVWAIAP